MLGEFSDDENSHLMGISLRATSWRPMYLESPVCLVASAKAKPPPSRRITPQGRRFSTENYIRRLGKSSLSAGLDCVRQMFTV